MLLEFSVKNFLSYKEKMTLSFEATKDKTLEEYYCYKINEKTRILKLGVLIGSNASGKTNILRALDFLKQKTIYPKRLDENTDFTPFLFDPDTRDMPGEFEIIFFVGNVKHHYSLILNKEQILEEKLNYYPKGQPVEVFKRRGDKIDFGTHKTVKLVKKDRDALDSNTVKTMTLLSALQVTKVKAPVLQNVVDWFRNFLMPMVKQSSDLRSWAMQGVDENTSHKKNIINLLKKADFNISDIIINREENTASDQLNDVIVNSIIPANIKRKVIDDGKPSTVELIMIHKTDNHGKEGIFSLNFEAESDGTKRYFELGGILSKLIIENHILAIDEIEGSLHPDLVRHFINTFLRNSAESQLIVTTHNIDFISDTDEIRKDVVWFTDKQRDGSTDLYSLADFSDLRKNMSYLKAYKSGKLGAVPNLGSTLVALGDDDGKKV